MRQPRSHARPNHTAPAPQRIASKGASIPAPPVAGLSDAGDITELIAIEKVFGSHAKSGLMISSTKSMTGHLLGAAGGLEAVISVLALNDGVIPPTINLDNPDPGCDLDYTPNTARERRFRYAMSNSFGFGGHNASVVIGQLRSGSA